MTTNIMVDIETLGTQKDSTILQISAVSFDIETGEVKNTFDAIQDISTENIKSDGDTLMWWLKTDSELLKKLVTSANSTDVLGDFHLWLKSQGNLEERFLWGNGILFDNNFIKSQLEHRGWDYPILCRNDRDVRTILDLASKKLGISVDELKKSVYLQERRSHYALDDGRNQVDAVWLAYNILMREGA